MSQAAQASTGKTVKALKEPRIFTVYDLNAKAGGPGRIHEIITEMRGDEVISTKSYELFSDRPCEMPEEHALKFLRDKAFVVMDNRGKRVEPVEIKDITSAKMRLEDNEVIAKLEELTREALLKRAKVMPGSEDVKASDTKETLVSFLVRKAREKFKVGVSRGSENAVAEMPVDELDKLIDQGK